MDEELSPIYACKAAQAHGIALEEVLDFSRHRDVKVLMIYRDRARNVQGTLAALVADAERLLTAQAQQQVRLERELGQLRALVTRTFREAPGFSHGEERKVALQEQQVVCYFKL